MLQIAERWHVSRQFGYSNAQKWYAMLLVKDKPMIWEDSFDEVKPGFELSARIKIVNAFKIKRTGITE